MGTDREDGRDRERTREIGKEEKEREEEGNRV